MKSSWFLPSFYPPKNSFDSRLFVFTYHRIGARQTVAVAAEWKPADGDWKEQDFESEIKKLEAEAEERLDAKISEMMSKIETTGASK